MFRLIIFLAVFVGAVWFFFGGGLQHHADTSLQDIRIKVASDAVDQYNIAAKQGNKTSMCVQAGFVAAAYLQAKDDANYDMWKTIESNDCGRAGVPR